MKSDDVLVITLTAAAVFFLVRAMRQPAQPLQGYLRYANSAPAGFVYDPVLDGYARTREDGVKEVYV